jgi:sporulation protein YlmC with PRC-barrel domain
MNAIARFSNVPKKATHIIGMGVVTGKGESLGSIKDMVVDQKSGMISYCVVSFGGFLGLRNKLFAIPFSAFAYDISEDEYVLDVSKERMEATPGFAADHWPLFADEQWGGTINSFFNTPPYWNNTADKRPAAKSLER